jgi:hypothetical protein
LTVPQPALFAAPDDKSVASALSELLAATSPHGHIARRQNQRARQEIARRSALNLTIDQLTISDSRQSCIDIRAVE